MKIKTSIFATVCIMILVLLASCNGADTPPEETHHTITFEYLNGESNTTQVIEKGSVITEPEKVPEKFGYSFEGWYFQDKIKWDFNDVPIKSITLNAKWRPIEYPIEYVNANGPREYYTIEDQVELTEGSRKSYEFFGWYEDEELTKPITKIDVGTTGAKKLYAKVVYQPFTLELLEDDTYKIVRFTDTDATEITIPAEYNGKKITVVGKNAFYDYTGLKSITLSDEITTLEYGAFGRCIGVETFTFGKGLTKISEKAFYYCAALTEIQIPSSVSIIEIDAFKKCNKLTIKCDFTEIPAGFINGWNGERPFELKESEN